MHRNRFHPFAPRPHLAVDNSGGGFRPARSKKRGVKLDLVFGAQLSEGVVNRKAVREPAPCAPVGNPAGLPAGPPGDLAGSAQGLDQFVNSMDAVRFAHGPKHNSRGLNLSSDLKRELRARANPRIISRMDAAPERRYNPRSLEAISGRLIVLRRTVGMSQGEFAAAAGIAANTYNQYEKAKSRPELDKAIMICDRFQVTLDWLYFGDPAGLPFQIADRLRAAG